MQIAFSSPSQGSQVHLQHSPLISIVFDTLPAAICLLISKINGVVSLVLHSQLTCAPALLKNKKTINQQLTRNDKLTLISYRYIVSMDYKCHKVFLNELLLSKFYIFTTKITHEKCVHMCKSTNNKIYLGN